jgi:serine protease Do
LVAEVTAEGPADRAGLKPGDVVLDVNGQAVDRASDLSRRVALVSPGQTIRLRISRNGKTEALSLTSGTRPSEEQLADNSGPSTSGPGERMLGMRLEPSPSGGLEVEGVNANSDASAKGVRPGDVIRKAGDRNLSSVADLSNALAAAKKAGRKDVLVLIARNGRQLFVPLHVDSARG